MKTDIVIAGVGGQGILSIGAALGTAALKNGMYMKQSETHGMSQRGGAVQAYMRISDKPIYADLISLGSADMILAVEPMESLRYLPYLSEKGYLITNSTPFRNIPDYPDTNELYGDIKKVPHHIIIDADEIATSLGSKKMANMVILGAAAPFIHLEFEYLKESIKTLFDRKGAKVVENNIKALQMGWDIAQKSDRSILQ